MNSATSDILEKTKSFIVQQETNTVYRTNPRRFTRTKKLSFKATIVLVLQKLVIRSDAFPRGGRFEKLSHHGAAVAQSVSKSAFVQQLDSPKWSSSVKVDTEKSTG